MVFQNFIGLRINNVRDICDTSKCSSIKIQYKLLNSEHPGEFILQSHEFPLEYKYDFFSSSNCLVSQKPEEQFLHDIIFTLYLTPSSNNPTLLYINVGSSSYDYSVERFVENVVLDNPQIIDDTINLGEADDMFQRDNFIVIHNKAGFPSQENFDYKKINIEPNPNRPIHLFWELKPWQALYFQEFTSLTPGNIAGSDSITHTLEIIQNGSNSCFQYAELVLNNTTYTYKSGEFDFTTKSSCIMLRENGVFQLAPEAHLKFSNMGRGIIAFNGGKTVLKENSILDFDGRIYLIGENGKQSEIHLSQDARIIFSKNVTIERKRDNQEMLFIYAKRDQVDLAKLSPSERAKIKIISTNKNVPIDGTLQFYPTIATDYLHFDILDNKTVSIYNYQGILIATMAVENNVLPVGFLAKGIYFIRSGNQTGKFFKLE